MRSAGASTVVVNNSIMWGTNAVSDQGGAATSIFGSDIDGGWNGDGEWNINADPQFADEDGADNILGTVDDDLRPSGMSLCIDAGITSRIPMDLADVDDDMDTAELLALTFDGTLRIICRVDMGALETLTISKPIRNITTSAYYCTIQEAIDAASPDDVIVLQPRFYNEAIDMAGMDITIQSTDPANPSIVASTVLDGTGLGTSVISTDNMIGADTVIDGLTIANGNAALGGGMLNEGGCPTVRRCVFMTNHASSFGGAMYNVNACSADIIACAFIGNDANSGGGIVNDGSAPNLVNCLFVANVSNTSGGAIYNINSSQPTVTNCTVTMNSAMTGAGDGMVNWNMSNPSVENSIFWNNGPSEIGGDGAPVVMHSIVAGGFAGVGNLDLDPQFVDLDGADDMIGTADDDASVGPTSPVIDAGDNTAPALVGVTADLNGGDRFVDDGGTADTGVGPAPVVDMGAHEFVDLCPADNDNDGMVGITDFLAILANWGPCGGACPWDTDGDGSVGITDFLAVLAEWGTCP